MRQTKFINATMTNAAKWIATTLLVIGSGINGFGMYPLGPLILLAGGTIWLIVSIIWREPALITTNALMSGVAVVGLAAHYLT